MNIKISEIKIGNRFRKNLGDITSLARNIERHGLLHPPVITENYELICGRRRIEAYKLLTKSEIEVNVLKLNHSTLSEAEADENIVRKNFTIDEIASIDEFYRKKEESEARQRQKQGRPSGKFPTGPTGRGRVREKIAARVGVSDRTLEKIRTIKNCSTEGDFPNKVWEKVAAGKIKVDKGYNQIRRFQRIKEAEKLASSSHFPSSNDNDNFSLHLGSMQEIGREIPSNSIDMIFTDPPYDEKSLYLYGELAKLAQRVLKAGASMVTVAGHYAIFKINDLIRSNSNLIYHWEISVNHTGHKKRLHGYRVWAYHKPLLWVLQTIRRWKRSWSYNVPRRG